MRVFRVFVVVMIGVILWNSCDDADPTDDFIITLNWSKAYSNETQADVITGLQWNLSFLGAELPQSFEITWMNDRQLVLDISRAGFSENALNAWRELLLTMKSSDEYSKRGGIDIGRFVMLTLNSTNHYYAITGAKRKLSDFRGQYTFKNKKVVILNSSIAVGHRVIEISEGQTYNSLAFVGIEGLNSVIDGTFIEKEFEAMDLMPNGQLRYALYDIDGNLKNTATSSLTLAGRPAKCSWCHEINLIPSFDETPDAVEGYYSDEEFNAILDERISIVNAYRSSLTSGVDFSKTQDHTKAELLYLSFMQPSAERLALEWGISVDEVKTRLNGKTISSNDEYPFLGSELYARSEIEQLGPYVVIRVPDEARNHSEYEPEIIKP